MKKRSILRYLSRLLNEQYQQVLNFCFVVSVILCWILASIIILDVFLSR